MGPGGGGVGEGVVLGVVNTEGVLTHDGAASWTVGMKLCDMLYCTDMKQIEAFS